MPEDLYGPIKATWNVEQAVLKTASLWWNEYLAEIERQNGYARKTIPRPPVPESFHGGLDFSSWSEDELPSVIAVVNPAGPTEYAASVGYIQAYEVQIGCAVGADGGVIAVQPEDEARAFAGFYGATSMLLVQQGSLGGFAERTRMVSAPRVDFLETVAAGAEQRRFASSVTVFHVWVAQLIQEVAGPFGLIPSEAIGFEGEEQAPGPLPTVKKTTVTVAAHTTQEEV